MHEQLGTDPQIKYLYTTPAVPGREPAASDVGDERMSDLANPLVGHLQTLWDWRAAMNWIFGGLASGAAVVAALAMFAGAIAPDAMRWVLAGTSALMAIGLFFVWLKIGRKFRAWRAVMRPQTSWMTRELYAAAVFFPLVLLNLLWPQPALAALAGAAALAFLLCQAKILHRARGIPAWRAPLIPWMIGASGLLEGFGLIAAAGLIWRGSVALGGPAWAIAGLGLVAGNAALWLRYRATARAQGIGPLARGALAEISLPLHVAGHAVPALLFAIGLFVPGLAPVCLAVGGVAALAGGAFWKFGMIVRAGFQQGFAVPKIPQRGSGAFAAPARLAGAPMRAAA
jgi:phenylacetyl-CoA:acceptor oxidoreductase subunit 2